MKTELKLNSEHLFGLATLEINAVWIKQYFFLYCLNTTVFQLSNFNIVTVIAVQKNVCRTARNGQMFTFTNVIAVSLLLLPFTCNSVFYFNIGKKLWRHISFSSACFFITRNILVMMIRFACYHLLLVSNSAFVTNSQYFGTIQTNTTII